MAYQRGRCDPGQAVYLELLIGDRKLRGSITDT